MYLQGYPVVLVSCTYKAIALTCVHLHNWYDKKISHNVIMRTAQKTVCTLALHSAQRVGQGEVGGVIRRVLCSWQLLGLAVKEPWLGHSVAVVKLRYCHGTVQP